MSQATAVISAEASKLVKKLLSEGLVIPGADNCIQYREEIRDACEEDIQFALSQFDGEIIDIEMAGIPCLQITPGEWSEDRGIVIQYAYGGGYVTGSSYEDLVITTALARYCPARVVSVNYRLSPEHPYPAPQDDFAQVYPVMLGLYGKHRLAISGESAGGNQALGLLQRARKQTLEMPACAALFSPWLDLAHQGDSHIINDNRDPTLSTAWVDSAARLHANGHALDDPGISPIHGDMNGLPPVILTTGSCELLLSDSLRLAQKLRNAGVECDLRVWEGMWHVFEYYRIPEAETSLREVAGFIRAHC